MGRLMDGDIEHLEALYEHAKAIAACSIGQPDRAENIAYREEIRARLEAAKATAAQCRRCGGGPGVHVCGRDRV